MFKKLFFLSAILCVNACLQASDPSEGVVDLRYSVKQNYPNYTAAQIESCVIKVTTIDNKSVDFMSEIAADKCINTPWGEHIRADIFDCIKQAGYEGAATSPRAAITEVLTRIKALEEAAAAPAPTAGGASAAGE